MQTKTYDVLIVGAGPAGTTLALALEKYGLKVVIVDKHKFPRDKVCGDAIPGRFLSVLKNVSNEVAQNFLQLSEKQPALSTSFFAPNGKHFSLQWKEEAYNCKRLVFDNFLLEQVNKFTQADILEQESIQDILINEKEVTLTTNNYQIKANILIGADGSNSKIAKQFVQRKMDRMHTGAAVRAYFENIAFKAPSNTEVYFLKKYLPGYFWIFPLTNQQANVGFGMSSAYISKHTIDLKKSFAEIISLPMFKARFEKAKPISKLQGFGLAFGSRKVKVSNQRLLLIGDAASLIDPVGGHGIGNAIISAQIASDIIKQAFEQQQFSATFFEKYDEELYKKLWKELKQRTKFQNFVGKYPMMVNFATTLLSKSSFLRKLLHRKL